MRTLSVVVALFLLAGCQQASQPQAQAPQGAVPAPPGPPPAATSDQAPPGPPVAKKFPLAQEEFKAGVTAGTREQVHEKYGQPDELGDWGAAVGWDGPVSIYHGPFTSADGEKKKARVYFRKQDGKSIVDHVEFVNM